MKIEDYSKLPLSERQKLASEFAKQKAEVLDTQESTRLENREKDKYKTYGDLAKDVAVGAGEAAVDAVKVLPQAASLHTADDILEFFNQDEAAESLRQMYREGAARSPVTTMAAEIASPLGVAKALKPLGAIGKQAAKVFSPKSVPQAAAQGAVTGVGVAESPEDAYLYGLGGAALGGTGQIFSNILSVPAGKDATQLRVKAIGTTGTDIKNMGRDKFIKNFEDVTESGFFSKDPVVWDIETRKFVPSVEGGIPLDPENPLESLYARTRQATKQSNRVIEDLLEDIPGDIEADEFINYEKLNQDLSNLEADLGADDLKGIKRAINKEKNNFRDILEDPDRGSAPDLSELEELKRRYQKASSNAYKSMALGKDDPTQLRKAKVKEIFARNLRRFVLDRIPDETTRESMRMLNRASSKQIPIQRILDNSITSAIAEKSKNPAVIGVGPTYMASKLAEFAGATPKGRLGRASIREGFDALPEVSRDVIRSTPSRFPMIEAARAMQDPEGMASLELMETVADPLSKFRSEPVREPQAIGPMVLDTKLPRNTEEAMRSPKLLQAKLLQTAGQEVALQMSEAISQAEQGNPRLLQTVLPQIAMRYPEMFEYDEYNSFDGKIIDPAAQALYRQSLSDSEEMDEFQKTQAINRFNKTNRMAK